MSEVIYEALPSKELLIPMTEEEYDDTYTDENEDVVYGIFEDDRTLLDQKMNELLSHLEDRPQVTFTYFVPDALKKGGSYKSSTGIVQKVDDYTRTLTLEGGERIEIGRIIDIQTD